MPLINLKTNLRSLKFGNDKPGGGSSNQPYIQKSIPSPEDSPSNIFNTGGGDSLLRGGLIAPLKAIDDVSRLSKMFFDFKSPNGFLFTPKQNLLSRTSVKTEASKGVGYGGGGVNQGIYLPISTIAQAGIGFTGTHLNLLGLDPTGLSNFGINNYFSIIKNQREENNRLVGLYNTTNNNKEEINFSNQRGVNLNTNNGTIVLEYGGGPGSILGIGKTKIKFADQRTGNNNPLSIQYPDYFNKGGIKLHNPPLIESFIEPTKASNKFEEYSNIIFWNEVNNDITTSGGVTWEQNFEKNVYKLGSFDNTSRISDNNTSTFSQQQIINVSNNVGKLTGTPEIQDFRKELLEGKNESTIMSFAPNYKTKNIEQRVNLGNPGKSKNVYNYGIPANQIEALDKITAMPLYESTSVAGNSEKAINDLVKFRIATINNNKNDGSAVYMHFRAFINNFNDNYSPDWNSVQYIGRGDSLANYGGFTRSIGMDFTVFAQSKAELIPMYKKLNYLASSTAPDYSESGFMRGNLIRLTMGGYIYEQPGYITSLTYTIPQESPWEIGINENGGYDSSVKELPHMINVNLSFSPIHNFLPQKVKDLKNTDQRYIALSNDNNRGNYVDEYKVYKPSGNIE